jgi:uncharacterized HAD superfamily protein
MDKSNKEFDKFQLEEYKNISQAHFKSIETISIFFRHYLLIMSIPIIVAGFFTKYEEYENFFVEYYQIFSLLLIVIALIGCCMLGWIIVLRMDGVLYARTINGVRKYFYDKINKDFERIIKNKVLPYTVTRPPYYEPIFFNPVIFCFIIINTIYFFFGVTICNFGGKIDNICRYFYTENNLLQIFISVIFAIFQYFVIYKLYYAKNREVSYLNSNIIGVDIDGVLNRHREKFCELLKKNTGKDLLPENITVIPVHDNPKLNITKEDEKKVFNDPEYWISMPKIDGAFKTLNKLKNLLQLKIFIFTSRDWPQLKNEEDCIKNNWGKNIDKITKLWLSENGLKFPCFFKTSKDVKLIIEKENKGAKNSIRRFSESIRNNIKFFVEDDLKNAIKLSYICDFIFLFDQPYNQEKNLPNNVFRVKSWEEIYKKIRELI